MTAVDLKLYEIADALVLVGETLEENGGELTPELTEALDGLELAWEDKVERCLLYAQNLKALSDAAAQESARLATLAQSRLKAAARFKEYIKAQMESAGRLKVETRYIVARVQKNARPSITYTGALETLPEGYVKIIRAFNNEVAYEAWKAGVPLPAGVDVLHGTHLRVS
jgi:hypothetical protein